jgi:hypothetical protein
VARPRIELKGRKVGRLIVLAYAGVNKSGNPMWLCRCRCGQKPTVTGSNLRNGMTRSCGCLRRDERAAKNKANAIHGAAGSRTYRSWESMKARCTKCEHIAWKRYGGRGITICKRWLHSFKNFSKDMGVRPAFKTLDRIENDKGYTPKNCRWAGRLTQRRNQRRRA